MWVERLFYTLPLRWRSLLRRTQVERELDDEIAYHLEQQVQDLVAAGVNPDEARHRVQHAFGAVDLAKERCRDARRVAFIETFLQDLRYAARTLRHTPAFTIVAVLTLALGTGANTAVFSLVDGILLARLPYPSPDRLVSIKATYPNGAFAALRSEITSLDVAAYADGKSFTLTGTGEPGRLSGARISASLFPLLGVKPELGRWLRPGEDLANRDGVVILSHALWETRFGGDRTILGRSIRLDGLSREVVAVMPASFRFPSASTQVWVPLGMDPANTARYWAGDFMPVIGRLHTGATREQAHTEVRRFQARVGALFPWRMPADWNRDITVVPLRDALVGDVRPRLLILIAGATLVLLTCCANVANLSLSRAVAREREIGIRTALGASPRRIARQLFTESALLAVLGAVAGLVVAVQALAILKRVLPPDTSRLSEVHLNWRVLVFTAIIAVLTGCAFGLAPVAQALRLRVRAVLDSGSRGGRQAVAGRLRTALTVGQIACAVLLVIAAALLGRSLWSLSRTDLGFRSDQVLTARVSPTASLCRQQQRCLAFYRAFSAQVQATPGVDAAALVNTLPLTGAVAKRSLEIEGYTPPDRRSAPLCWLNVITPDYFRVMHMRLESGRAFSHEDLAGGPLVAIVPSSTARRFWPGTNPVGRRVRFVGESAWRTVVGVVADVRAYDLTRNVPDWMAGALYVPYTAAATMEDGSIPTNMMLTLASAMPPAQMAATLRQLAASLTGEVVVDEVRPMKAVLGDAVAGPTATASLVVSMAALALVLGCIGVYGVLSFLISRQTRDLGIRLALGAQRRDVFWLVIGEGARLCVAGVVLGVAGAMAITRWLASELHGISPTDPVTYAVVVVATTLVTMAACYVPTRRAMGVNPLVVLRDQ
jgi:predicted permease